MKSSDISHSEGEDEEDDLPIAKPRGKLAARMMGKAGNKAAVMKVQRRSMEPVQIKPTSVLDPQELAGAPLAPALGPSAELPSASQATNNATEVNDEEDEEDEDEIIPVGRRRRALGRLSSPVPSLPHSPRSQDTSVASSTSSSPNMSKVIDDIDLDDDDLPDNLFTDKAFLNRMGRLKNERAEKMSQDAAQREREKQVEADAILEDQGSADSGDDEALLRSTERPRARKVCVE